MRQSEILEAFGATKINAFIDESNRIEGIHRSSTLAEKEEFFRFMSLEEITIEDLIQFVATYQPGARLRDKKGLDVVVGNHTPPKGGIEIKERLHSMLHYMVTDKNRYDPKVAYITHQMYETLHPFTDGNGRSGRMLWLWMMGEAPLGFLHTWYYQSLRYSR